MTVFEDLVLVSNMISKITFYCISTSTKAAA